MTVIEFIGDKSTHIAVVPEIIPVDVCDGLIDLCKKDWTKLFFPGPTLGGLDTSIKNTMDFNFSGAQAKELGCDFDAYFNYEMKIYNALWTSMSIYTEQFPAILSAPNLYDTGFRIQNYKMANGFYRSHWDGAPWDDEPIGSRVLGVVMYLNDVNRGGETWFPTHNLKVKATIGSIAIFPANWTHPHQACVPISNDKWIISSFICATKKSILEKQLLNKNEVSVIDTNPANQPCNQS